MSAPIREPAPAKLNLFLRVLGRRDDGYHEVETLVLPLTLADGVEAAPAEGLTLTVAGPRAAEVPAGEENLVLRAARALAEEARVEARARLLLVKHVPVAAGLGGGSADAAAALRALNDLWGCGLDGHGLVRVAAEVGSDVPALVLGGPVLARGRGERVEPMEIPRTWWVLVPSHPGIAAGDAYGWWEEDGAQTGDGIDDFLEAAHESDLTTVVDVLSNDLEPSVARRRDDVGEARERLLNAGVLGAILCGSGPTVAGLCRDGRHAEGVAALAGGVAAASLPGHSSR